MKAKTKNNTWYISVKQLTKDGCTYELEYQFILN